MEQDFVKHIFEEQLEKGRLAEQRQKNDYSDDGEVCECGCRINSHGHCPRCDY